MKLIFAIIQADDADNVVGKLVRELQQKIEDL